MDNELTAERARELLSYDQFSGVLTWRVDRGGSARAGSVAGAQHDARYLRLTIDRKSYKAHRVIFLLMTGCWPNPRCDHIDLDKTNNRWKNLREATVSQNGANRQHQINSASGVKGVIWLKRNNKWLARIKFHGKMIHVGLFADLEQARSAYKVAADRYFGEFARV